jgi:hypothetical protein
MGEIASGTCCDRNLDWCRRCRRENRSRMHKADMKYSETRLVEIETPLWEHANPLGMFMTRAVSAQNCMKTALGTPARLSNKSHTSSRGHRMAVTPPHAGYVKPVPPAAHHDCHHRVNPYLVAQPSLLGLHPSPVARTSPLLSLSLINRLWKPSLCLATLTPLHPHPLHLPCRELLSPPGDISSPPQDHVSESSPLSI